MSEDERKRKDRPRTRGKGKQAKRDDERVDRAGGSVPIDLPPDALEGETEDEAEARREDRFG